MQKPELKTYSRAEISPKYRLFEFPFVEPCFGSSPEPDPMQRHRSNVIWAAKIGVYSYQAEAFGNADESWTPLLVRSTQLLTFSLVHFDLGY
jgi:hypothetical protein